MTVDVPATYGRDRSDGDTVALRVARLSDSTRGLIGRALFVLPGGPGTPAIDNLAAARSTLEGLGLGDVTILAVDPRGVGASKRANPCAKPSADLKSTKPAPSAVRTEEDFGRAATIGRRAVDSCGAGGQSVGSAVDAEDLHRVIRRLGIHHVSVIAASYSAHVVYDLLLQHPGDLDHVVLDAPVDPAQPLLSQIEDVADAAEHELDRQLAAYSKTFPGSTSRVNAALISGARQTGASSPPDPQRVARVVLKGLQQGGAWPEIVLRAVDAWAEGEPEQISKLLEQLDPTPQPELGTLVSAIRCNDRVSAAGAEPLSWTDARPVLQRAPRLGPALALELARCATSLVARSTARPIASAPPTLILVSVHDPVATPAGAAELSARLNGQLITLRTAGHTTLFRSACARAAVTSFLRNREVQRSCSSG